jgi:LysR family glycine cleavage system transcriptional activator
VVGLLAGHDSEQHEHCASDELAHQSDCERRCSPCSETREKIADAVSGGGSEPTQHSEHSICLVDCTASSLDGGANDIRSGTALRTNSTTLRMREAHVKRSGLPSLSGLQAFEAAARLLSFTRAAEEIGITPTGISHRIRALEEELGVKLFRRGHRSILLTQQGEQVARDLADSFDCMRLSVARLRGGRQAQLTLAAEEGFAALWLIPRIAAFRARHPDLSIRIEPQRGSLDFERSGSDAAIVFSRQEQCDGISECLVQTRLVPVCAPALARTGALAVEELVGRPLLHLKDTDPALELPGWEAWFRIAGASTLPALGGIAVGSLALQIEAARAGLGAALAPAHLVAGDLASGRLVSPHPAFLPASQAHLLVYPQEHRTRAPFRAFRTWLLAEARRGTPVAPTAAR